MATISNTQVNLDGLLETLGKSLYSSPSVALRELVQNAHDACERYTIETGLDKEFKITLIANSDSGTLEIIDNGSGLTFEEINEYLATVGTGYTRVLRDQTDSKDMIGYFGLGFLSTYVVSDKVEVYTTSFKQPDTTWQFTSSGGKTFSIRPSKNEAVGSRVKLQLKPDFLSLSDEAVIYSLIEKYCCLLSTPIKIEGGRDPINNLIPPWLFSESVSPLQRKKRSLEFANVFEHDFEPICTIEIPHDNPYNLKGVLWVQGGSSYATSDNRNVSVFIRSMFITSSELDLLPSWAGFVGGVFESADFLPTASRESLQKNSYFQAVSSYIKETLITGLRDIVLREPETWRRILTRHDQTLLGAALSDGRLFDVCRKQLKVPTSFGNMTLPQLISKSEGIIYIKPGHERGFEDSLFRARKIPVVKGFLYGSMEFCNRYSSSDNCKVLVLGKKKDEATILPRLEDKSIEYEGVKEYLVKPDETLIASRFAPSSIPLLVIEDQEVKLKKRIEQENADKRIGAAALSLARLHTKSISDDCLRRVYINVDNPVIERLLSVGVERQKCIAKLLRSYFDSMNLSDDQNDSDYTRSLNVFNESLLALID